MLKSNQDLQDRYSIQLHTTFSILQNDLTDTIDDKHQHFITANNETAKKTIPKKAKWKKMKYSDDETVKQARSNIYTTYSCYTSNPTEERGTSLQIKIREY